MRRRTKRDLAVFAGIIMVIAGTVLTRGFLERNTLASRMEVIRKQTEQSRKTEGLELMQWPVIQKTTGTVKKGPTFDPQLEKFDKQRVDLVGFMVPLEQFRDMTEFLLLPLPIECYFCQSPPMRDVMIVQMAKGKNTKLFKEPVLINGVLTLNRGAGTKFFYTISEAELGPGKKGGKLTQKDMAPEHMVPGHQPTDDQLVKPMAPPAPAKLQ